MGRDPGVRCRHVVLASDPVPLGFEEDEREVEEEKRLSAAR